MNDFLNVLVGLAFGAGASYLFAVTREFDRRRRRIKPVRAAMHAIRDLGQYITIDRNRAAFNQIDPGAAITLYQRNVAVIAGYIVEEYASTHTRDELRLDLGLPQERAP